MDACGCDAFASIFDRRNAEDDLRRYRREGPDKTTRMLLELIRAQGVDGATVLDIGGGIGIIDQELLRAGASRSTLADASQASVAIAREAAAAAGLADRMTFVEGDAVRRAADIPGADVVTLDRVICCYPDVTSLVGLSAARAGRLYGIVLPRDRWMVRAGIALEALWFRFLRKRYRPFAHSNRLVDDLAVAAGLEQVAESGTFFWRVALFRRPAGTAA
ncbi:MAG: methyltransferase domain-containing protein [Candidatus Limnocylindrales bacterium]